MKNTKSIQIWNKQFDSQRDWVHIIDSIRHLRTVLNYLIEKDVTADNPRENFNDFANLKAGILKIKQFEEQLMKNPQPAIDPQMMRINRYKEDNRGIIEGMKNPKIDEEEKIIKNQQIAKPAYKKIKGKNPWFSISNESYERMEKVRHF